MTLKDISHSGLLKLALLFIIIPRIASHIYYLVTRPFVEMVRGRPSLSNINTGEVVEVNTQPIEMLSTTLTKEVIFIFTLVFGAYILTKVIEYLAQNTKLGGIKLGHRTD